MKSVALFVCLSLLVLATSSPVEIKSLNEKGYTSKPHAFNADYLTKTFENLVDSVVYFKTEPLTSVQNLARVYKTILNENLKAELDDAIISCSKGDSYDFFKFGATHVATIGNGVSEQSFSGDCFANTKMTYTKLDATTAQIEIEAQNPTSELCSDFYLFGTTLNYHVENVFFHGKTVVTFKNLSAKEMQNVESYGIHAFRFCDKLTNILPDILYTSLLFLGGFGTDPNIPVFGSKPTFWMEMANEAFIKRATGYEWQKRQDVFVEIDEKEIHSGDFIAITRFDGIDQIIQWGAGSAAGHSTVALWIDGELNVIESQDGWYWPKHGIQRNNFSQWTQWARNAGFNVAVLPLAPEYRAIFNETAAYEWFKTVEGLPYGYHNFLFGWIDTPDKSYPPLLHPDLLPVVFSILEKFVPNVVDIFLNQALNKRLNTTNLTLTGISEVLHERNMSFPELMAMVEKEGWVYNDGVSYVCSSFVVAIYERAGLFKGLHVEATEFTPKDVYTLRFFDSNYTKPKACQDADPELPYCQLMGKHKMILPGYNTIEPYEHMNERCESVPPHYNRTAGC